MVIRAGRVSEKVVQRRICELLALVHAKVYTIGRPPRRDAVHKGTGQTPGIPDLLVFLPKRGSGLFGGHPHQLWIEVKAVRGRLSEEQKAFRDWCALAGIPHLVGDLDTVRAYLQAHGYLSLGAAKPRERAYT